MVNSGDNKDNEIKSGFGAFASKRIIIIAVIAVIGLWCLVKILDLMDKPENLSSKQAQQSIQQAPTDKSTVHSEPAGPKAESMAPAKQGVATGTIESGEQSSTADEKSHGSGLPGFTTDMETAPVKAQNHEVKPEPPSQEEVKLKTTPNENEKQESSGHRPFEVAEVNKVRGAAFVEALIEPLDYELNKRRWGWRPNDIIDVTDNVNNMQLGILEFTRRTSIVFAEKLSRTGATASFDPNLQQAMNWFMIKAEQYWLPSPEDKYNEGLKNLRAYKSRLEKGTATFYTRNDNLIPLLSVYEDLLGSCEENLVKVTEDNGDPISFFMADDHFYYAKGVAMAMLPVLEAVSVDFASTVENRRGTDVLRHAIEALHHAIEIDPIVITNSDLDGILANHRANMAAPISHARFYLGVLIKTLST